MNLTLVIEGLRLIADGLDEALSKPEPEPEPKPEPVVAQPVQTPPPPPEPAASDVPDAGIFTQQAEAVEVRQVTVDDVQTLFQEVAQKKGQPTATETIMAGLKSFGTTSVRALSAEQRAALYRTLEEALNA